jgi:CMP/dCMP kinase
LKDKPFIVAIDGPAASGKGTLGRRLAEVLGFQHLDTGLTYRAVGQALIQAELPLENEALAVEAARNVDFAALDREILSGNDIGEAASRIAVMAGVRRILVERQREFASYGSGTVLDGRDIGTVVFPEADVKLFVTASAETRAGRRYEEISKKGGHAELSDILRDLQRRDARDMGRVDSPLRPAEDAHLIDTSTMDIETAFRTALAIIKKAGAGRI